MTHTARSYNAPEDVVYDTHLSQREKLKVLHDWKDEMDSAVHAEEDNEAPKGKQESGAEEELKRINEALMMLEEGRHEYGLSKTRTSRQ